MSLWLSLLLFYGAFVPLPTHMLRCPPNKNFVSKEYNGFIRCYTVYRGTNPPDRCKYIDYCRGVNRNAIPATINSMEELAFIRTFAQANTYIFLGVYIPCPQKYGRKNFVNIDNTLLPVKIDVLNDKLNKEYFIMLRGDGKIDDLSLDDSWYKNDVLCALTLQDYVPPPHSAIVDVKGADYGCPDDSYIYGEFIGIRKCYKVYKSPNVPDKCNLSAACLGLHKDAQPVSLDSILERDFIKNLAAEKDALLLGDYIPCSQSFDEKSFVKPDGSPVDVPFDEYQISTDKTNSFIHYYDIGYISYENDELPNQRYTNQVMCAITLPHCPFPFRLPKNVKTVTADTVCEATGPPKMYYIPPVFPEDG